MTHWKGQAGRCGRAYPPSLFPLSYTWRQLILETGFRKATSSLIGVSPGITTSPKTGLLSREAPTAIKLRNKKSKAFNYPLATTQQWDWVESLQWGRLGETKKFNLEQMSCTYMLSGYMMPEHAAYISSRIWGLPHCVGALSTFEDVLSWLSTLLFLILSFPLPQYLPI